MSDESTDTHQGAEIQADVSRGVDVDTSRQFTSWLREMNAALAFTTPQGKLFTIGRDERNNFTLFNRSFDRPQGLCHDSEALYVACRDRIIRLCRVGAGEQQGRRYDAVYMPRAIWMTGEVDIRALDTDRHGVPVFASARLSCAGRASLTYAMEPVWRPSFISAYSIDTRCFLNGAAFSHDRLRYATAAAATDTSDGWRAHVNDGGVVIDTVSNEYVLQGLSLPMAPTIYGGKLYMLQAGTGELGVVDQQKQRFEALATLPGIPVGASFISDFAVVAVTARLPDLDGMRLPIMDRLDAHGQLAENGLYIVNLKTGDIEQHVRVRGVIDQLSDVAILPGAQAAAVIRPDSSEIASTITLPESLAKDDRA